MIDAKVTGGAELVQRFEASNGALGGVVEKAVERVGKQLVRTVQNNYLSGQALNARTGRLRSSIAPGHPESLSGLTKTADKVTYTIGTKVPYGVLYEQGGTIPAHTIHPKNASVLRFMVGGNEVFAKYANIPARTVPPRPFLKPAMDELHDEFAETIREDVEAALRKAVR